MTRQDEIAAKAVRISTLKSLKQKRALRIRQIKEEAANKIRELNIQYSEDPERLRAKYAADDYAKSEKAKKRAAKAIEKEKKHLERERNLRPFTLGEEIFSSIVQGIGACLFIAATVLLNVFTIGKVPAEDKTLYITLFSCFGGTMTLMYIMSVLDHALTPSSAKETFKRLAHIFIFLVIGTTYTVYTFKAVTEKKVMLFIKFTEQNNGVFPKSRRDSFSELTDNEIAELAQIVNKEIILQKNKL